MKISILTLFPQMFFGPFDHSILRRAQEKKLLALEFIDIRTFGIGKHRLVDDTPYGGGVGMILRIDVLEKALQKGRCKTSCRERVIRTDARGETFSQSKAQELTSFVHLIFIAGHYEGVDERVLTLVDEQISLGDFVLTGGEIPIVAMVDAIARLLPNVLAKKEAVQIESFAHYGYLEFPQYTKPPVWKGKKVPDVLLSGNHQKIAEWRKEAADIISKGRS